MENSKFKNDERYIVYIQELSDICNIETDLLEEILAQGILPEIVSHVEENLLDANDIEELKRIRRLYEGLGVNIEGIAVILDMRQRMIEMQQQLINMQRKLQALEQQQFLQHDWEN